MQIFPFELVWNFEIKVTDTKHLQTCKLFYTPVYGKLFTNILILELCRDRRCGVV